MVGGHRLRIGWIGAVCTRPAHRGRGLASAILAATLDRFRQDGVDFVYITGRRPLYLAAGANHVAMEVGYSLRPGALPPSPLPVVVRQAAPADLDALIALASAEGTRVMRPHEDLALTLDSGFAGGREGCFHLIELHEVPVGYLLQRNQRDGSVQFVEAGGDRACVMAALGVLVTRTGGETVGLFLPRGDRLVELLAAAGIQGVPAKSGGTVIAANPARTLAKLAPYVRERLPWWPYPAPRLLSGGGRYVIQDAGGMLEVDGEDEMLWLLVGRPLDAAPSSLWATGRMRELVASCLPIGLPSIYLNLI